MNWVQLVRTKTLFMIKQIGKKDEEFRWLFILPVKRNQVDKYRKKVRPYVE